MEISHIMKRLQDSQTASEAGVKTASVNSGPQDMGASLRSELHNAIQAASEPVQMNMQQKTASVQNVQEDPSADLMKMASDLSMAEEEALVKQAQVYGAAIADGFMSRYGQYEQAAAAVTPVQKTASYDNGFEKFASENPALVKEAYARGYNDTIAQYNAQQAQAKTASYDYGFEKFASENPALVKEAYRRGYNDTVAQYNAQQAQVKTASYDYGFEKFASENPVLVKEAYDLGYQTKIAELQKEAQGQYSAGYSDTINAVHKTASTLYKHGSEWAQWAVRTAEQA